jgi:hypothetical protein
MERTPRNISDIPRGEYKRPMEVLTQTRLDLTQVRRTLYQQTLQPPMTLKEDAINTIMKTYGVNRTEARKIYHLPQS